MVLFLLPRVICRGAGRLPAHKLQEAQLAKGGQAACSSIILVETVGLYLQQVLSNMPLSISYTSLTLQAARCAICTCLLMPLQIPLYKGVQTRQGRVQVPVALPWL